MYIRHAVTFQQMMKEIVNAETACKRVAFATYSALKLPFWSSSRFLLFSSLLHYRSKIKYNPFTPICCQSQRPLRVKSYYLERLALRGCWIGYTWNRAGICSLKGGFHTKVANRHLAKNIRQTPPLQKARLIETALTAWFLLWQLLMSNRDS